MLISLIPISTREENTEVRDIVIFESYVHPDDVIKTNS